MLCWYPDMATNRSSARTFSFLLQVLVCGLLSHVWSYFSSWLRRSRGKPNSCWFVLGLCSVTRHQASLSMNLTQPQLQQQRPGTRQSQKTKLMKRVSPQSTPHIVTPIDVSHFLIDILTPLKCKTNVVRIVLFFIHGKMRRGNEIFSDHYFIWRNSFILNLVAKVSEMEEERQRGRFIRFQDFRTVSG